MKKKQRKSEKGKLTKTHFGPEEREDVHKGKIIKSIYQQNLLNKVLSKKIQVIHIKDQFKKLQKDIAKKNDNKQ